MSSINEEVYLAPIIKNKRNSRRFNNEVAHMARFTVNTLRCKRTTLVSEMCHHTKRKSSGLATRDMPDLFIFQRGIKGSATARLTSFYYTELATRPIPYIVYIPLQLTTTLFSKVIKTKTTPCIHGQFSIR